MTYWFSSDPHFGHKNIITYCDRPFSSVPEMNEKILAAYNRDVGVDDTLVLLGDLCMGKLEDSLPYLSRIGAGRIVLLPGNHDRWSLAYHHKRGEEARSEWSGKYRMNERIEVLEDRPTSEWRGSELGLEGALAEAKFSHFPYEGDSHDEDRYRELRPVDDGGVVIHGHVHTEWKTRGRQFNVGVDVNEFRPVHEDEVVNWIAEVEKR